jgi:hypothetical protein
MTTITTKGGLLQRLGQRAACGVQPGLRDSFWLQGMWCGHKAGYDCIKNESSDVWHRANHETSGMSRRNILTRGAAMFVGLLIWLLPLVCASPCLAQALPPLRSVYTQGFRSTNSGVMPDPGLTYSNTFMDYSFDQLKCPGCGLPPELNVGVYIDLNIFMYVTNVKILGGNYAILVGLPLSTNAISLPGLGPKSAGNGFSDSFYQPFTLGWHLKRADITTAYALFAPTGRFTPGASNNTGSGYWTNAPTAGETVYLTKKKMTSISAYELYEFHTTQKGTAIHPGQAFNLDYSVTQSLPLTKDMHTLLQVGLAGYGMWQTSDNSGPGITPTLPGHYRTNALGGAVNILLPARKANLGVSLLKEFASSNTVQGYSLQITGGIRF